MKKRIAMIVTAVLAVGSLVLIPNANDITLSANQPYGMLRYTQNGTAIGTIADGVVPVTLGPLSVLGKHSLTVLATYSNSEKSEIKLIIPVEF
jgi:hypothetical protein